MDALPPSENNSHLAGSDSTIAKGNIVSLSDATATAVTAAANSDEEAATTTTTSAATAVTGLFVGLALNPSAETTASLPKKSTNTTSCEEKTRKKNKNKKDENPPSRSSTPVHSNTSFSNTSPPPTPVTGFSDTSNPSKREKSLTSNPLLVAPKLAPPPLFPSSPAIAVANDSTTVAGNITGAKRLLTRIHLAAPSHARVPHPDTALRLLRKFYARTSPSIPLHAGGSRPSSWFGWVFGSAFETAFDGESACIDCYMDFAVALELSKDNGRGEHERNKNNDDTGAPGEGICRNSCVSEEDIIVESILGHHGDSPSKARSSVASFIALLATWCRWSMEAAAISQEMDARGEKVPRGGGAAAVMGVVTPELIGIGIDTASGLVAHGCLDGFYVISAQEDKDGDDGDTRGEEAVGAAWEEPVTEAVCSSSLSRKAVELLVESVCIANLSSERTELSALKFLLTIGCRAPVADAMSEAGLSTRPPEPMLRGTHLLQTVRVCSSIYLHTESEPNRTTAKAALQQLVVTVFVRLERVIEGAKLRDQINSNDVAGTMDSSMEGKRRAMASSKEAAFATMDHKDAYLVLRSLCKLSVRSNAPQAKIPRAVLLTAIAKGPEGDVAGERMPAVASTATTAQPVPFPPDDSYDPALESRILALQLLLHILRHSSAPAILHAGSQFHYVVRQYLCTSLLKNTTSADTTVLELSLRLFVPLIRSFRSLLKTEIEAFVTKVFFVILDSKNSTVQHKLLMVTLFEEICSDATTLAEIFLNYDCDLSAVDLFSRIVNALGKVAQVGLSDATGSEGFRGGSLSAATSSLQFVAGAGAVRAEMTRLDHRELRLAAMKALRQVLASLHSSIVTPANSGRGYLEDISLDKAADSLQLCPRSSSDGKNSDATDLLSPSAKLTLVELYDSKKKRREEESQAAIKFNQKPTSGLKYAAEHGLLNAADPADVARYLLQNKDLFDKAQIGEYLGREKEWRDGFALKVLHAFGDALDFRAMAFDDAIRYYLSGFRLPGEAQKIDRIMEVFAARYTDQNVGIFPNADSAFILAFSIIMLNTDLHNPAIKEERKMTVANFIRMNSGVCDGGDFPDEMLTEIWWRIKENPISLKEDDDARQSAGIGKAGIKASSSASGLSDFFFGSHYIAQDKTREVNYQKEGDQIVRDTESMLRRRRKATRDHKVPLARNSKKALRHGIEKPASIQFVETADSGLKDEYVTPMFDVAWGPSLAVFSTAIESANGTEGILASIATEEEMDHAVENAASANDVSLNGFQLAICIAGLCGNKIARDAYVRALYNFTLLGSSHLLADRHIQCVHLLLRLGRDHGEILGVTWEHIFRALTEIYRLHQVWEGIVRNERKGIKARQRMAQRAGTEISTAEQLDDNRSEMKEGEEISDTSSVVSDWNDVDYLEEEMDKRMIDESNAMLIHNTIPPDLVDSIFHRSTSLSRLALKDFVYQLCRVSRMEISGYGGHVGSDANDIDLTNDHYTKHHTLVTDSKHGSSNAGISATQPAIYCLEKLVEVTHFNMESRPRVIFADIWGTISMHLTSTALHEEAAVAMYAVVSLRQLSLQFLNREELGAFEFQHRFLKSLETIMSRSSHVSIKELLLSSVEQLISIYGFGDTSEKPKNSHQGTLRSGWRSILAVLGTAGLDNNDSIALQGFKLLMTQINHSMLLCNEESGGNLGKQPDSLLSEHFVDLVNTLLLYISGPRLDMRSKSMDSLVHLSDLLAKGKVPLSSTWTKSTLSSVNLPGPGCGVEAHSINNDVLELWWPMLLGLSQTMGDRRPEVRVKGLGTLFHIINKHFFPTSSNLKTCVNDNSLPQHGDLQTLQLIFRGILVPALEFEEMDGNSTSCYAPELLPSKFVHFRTLPPPDASVTGSQEGGLQQNNWIDTTFEHLMDGCISICLRSFNIFNCDFLVEEVLAMLNNCLLSDSGHLAVKGIRRLKRFISKDLELKDLTDDTWATVSHMLFRVLSIRGLPLPSMPEDDGATDKQEGRSKLEYTDKMNEFVREQRLFSNRRYIGCNAAMVIGSLLTNDAIVESMGVDWYIFLMSGLGKGIRDWERAAEIVDSNCAPDRARPLTVPSPPHYLENVLYAYKWVAKVVIGLLTQRELPILESTSCQHVLKEETESLLRAFLAIESNESCNVNELRSISKTVSDILECFNTLGDDKISALKWLSPVLSACIQTNNVTIRTSVQILLTRMLKEANQANANKEMLSSEEVS